MALANPGAYVEMQDDFCKSSDAPVWNEDYPVWWHLTNVRLLDEPIPCRGNVGMWRLPEDVCKHVFLKE